MLSLSSRAFPFPCSLVGPCHCITADRAPGAGTVTAILLSLSLSNSLLPHHRNVSSHSQPESLGDLVSSPTTLLPCEVTTSSLYSENYTVWAKVSQQTDMSVHGPGTVSNQE